MSAPSTPTRSCAGSKLSTPEVKGNGVRRTELTPRSKIRAMLAAIDDSDEEVLQIARDTKAADADGRDQSSRSGIDSVEASDMEDKDHKLSRKTTHITKASSSTGKYGDDDDDEGEDDGDEDLVPRGRMAARMRGRKLPAEDDSSNQPHEATLSDTFTREKTDRQVGEKKLEDTFMLKKRNVRSADSKVLPGKKATVPRKSIFGSPEQSPVEGLDDVSRKTSQKDTVDSGDSYRRIILSPDAPAMTATQAAGNENRSDSDTAIESASNKRFLALVAKKRAERQAKEVAEERKRAELQASLPKKRGSSVPEFSGSEEDDIVAGKKLTQSSGRPTVRKASKKAMEELSRETQRISRNMQLAHEAKTKKKISKDSLLERFNFRRVPGPNPAEKLNSSTSNSSEPGSDAEESGKQHLTPLSSPSQPVVKSAVALGKMRVPLEEHKVTGRMEFGSNEELPSIENFLSRHVSPPGKGNGKLIEEFLPSPAPIKNAKKTFFNPKSIYFRLPIKDGPDSDSDLEIVPVNEKRQKLLSVFDRIPARKAADPGQSLLKLRALANLTSPGKKHDKSKASMTPSELQASLQRRARQQAARERQERVKDLEARGIVVQSKEDRERDQEQIEDILEKARREADELTKKEKKERKEGGGENGKLHDDDSDDEDYEEAEAVASDVEVEIELSGSEDESMDEEMEDEEDLGESNGLIDGEASESENDEEDELIIHDEVDKEAYEEASDAEDLHVAKVGRRSNQHRVIDEDDDEDDLSEKSIPSSIPHTPAKNNNPFADVSTIADIAPIGLTQAFASSMSDSIDAQSQSQAPSSLAMLGDMPVPNFPIHNMESPIKAAPTQPIDSMLDIDLHFSQSQILPDSMQEDSAMTDGTQMSEIPDPTQDAGFGVTSPMHTRFAQIPESTSGTVDTVIMPPVQVQESPISKKKGRLIKRKDAIAAFSDEDEPNSDTEDAGFDMTADAFDVMKKKATKKAQAEIFDKKKSNAKRMVEEQAEESEDEYAGLGGNSDDESGGEADEEMKKMIDEGEVHVDESKLAAFYADKDRLDDEAAVQKLFKDINNGGLRRKRGAGDFDIEDDSDDNIENRRRRKRAEFAKMRKALLDQNENMGKIAEDPKKQAFLRAIEDRDTERFGDDDIDFLNDEDDDATNGEEESQSQTPNPASTQEVPDSQVENHLPASRLVLMADEHVTASATINITSTKRKRPLEESRNPQQPTTTNPRRTAARLAKKPASLAEIRASVSFLTEDPRAIPLSPEDPSSDVEAEDSLGFAGLVTEQVAPDGAVFNRRQRRRRAADPVVDRLELKRAGSSTLSLVTSAGIGGSERLAFHDPATSNSTPGFKVPSLILRRSTTMDSTESYGISHGGGNAGTERAIGGEKGDFVRRGGSKKSSINWFAREEERRKAVGGGEMRREEGRKAKGKERRGVLGALGGGRWG